MFQGYPTNNFRHWAVGVVTILVLGFGIPAQGSVLSDAERQELRAQLDSSIALLESQGRLGNSDAVKSAPGATPFSHWPVQASPRLKDPSFYRVVNFVDHDPQTDSKLDYNCGTRTYDSGAYDHKGIDISLRYLRWTLMDDDLGEVVAAASGQIIRKEDGHADRTCSWENSGSWNGIFLRHPDGSESWYLHFKEGSLTDKEVGDWVAGGEFLGIVGSSGNSTGPHLHFEVYGPSGDLIDPFEGECNGMNAEGKWQEQLPYLQTSLVKLMTGTAPATREACMSNGQFSLNGEQSFESRRFKPGDPVTFTANFRDIPGTSADPVNIAFRVVEPDGTVHSSWSRTYSNTALERTVVQTLNDLPQNPGTWTFEVDFDGTTQMHAFEITEGCMSRFGDFNGDGFCDLAIGVPGEKVSGEDGAGQVNVLYGEATGLSADGNQIWHQDIPSVNDFASAGEAFGSAVAIGDFDNDGFDDLAVGVPKEEVANKENAGLVGILYGTVNGLAADGDQKWSQDSSGVASSPEAGDRFGYSLAAGNFNCDEFTDLVVGVPYKNVNSLQDAGAIHALYGSSAGLSSSASQYLHQDSAGVASVAREKELFGRALAAGDFNGDGIDDLAVGAPNQKINGNLKAGYVNVLYGGCYGLLDGGSQGWHQDSSGVQGESEDGDRFGRALAVGDFDGDGYDDLAIGVPKENVSGKEDAGAVNVLYGSSSGLTASADDLFYQGHGGLDGKSESEDRFGTALTAGDFDGDGFDDLAIGVPGESVQGSGGAGKVVLLYGSPSGLTTVGSHSVHQNRTRVAGVVEGSDEFGAALWAADFDGDGFEDLVVGVPGEDLDGTPNPGMVNILYGSAAGISTAGTQGWNQDTDGILGSPNNQDQFGGALP